MLNKKLKKVIASVTMFATVLCFSSVSMLALPLSAQAATAIVDGDIVKTNVTNSDGTPSISSLDVYIVKTVGSKKFKRLVLNPNIFASYSHLKWENLKTVSQAEIDVYTTSSLVRVDGNDKVYAITPVPGGDTGAKSWINLTAAQFLSLPQSDPDSIYTINSVDGAAYSAKADITTVAQLTAFYATGALPDDTPVITSDLTVSLLASTPRSMSIPVNSSAEFAAIKLAAGSLDVSINSLTVTASGFGDSDNLNNVALYIDGAKVGSSKDINSEKEAAFNFSTPIKISANGSKTLTIKASANAAGTYILGIKEAADVITAGGTVAGSFPIYGNGMAADGNVTAGTVTLDGVETGDPSNSFGDDNVLLAGFDLTANNEGAIVDSLRLKNGGTNEVGIISNLRLVIDGDEVAKGTYDSSTGYVDFPVNGAFKIKKGDSASVEVYGDIGVASAEDTIDLYIKNKDDFAFTGEDYGFGVQVVAITLLDTAGKGITVLLTTGDVSIDMDKAATPAKDVKADTDNVVLATFSVISNGENATLESIVNAAGEVFQIQGAGLIADSIENVEMRDTTTGAIYDIDASFVGATEWDLSMTDEISLVKGVKKTFEIRADLNSILVDGSTLKVVVDDDAMTITGDASDSAIKDITPISVSSAVSTVKDASLDWTTTFLKAQTVVPGTSDVVIYQASLESGAVDGVKLSSVTLTTNGAGVVDDFTDSNISNLDLYLGDKKINSTKPSIVESVVNTPGHITFSSLSSDAVVAAGATAILQARATFASSLTPVASFSLEIDNATSSIIVKSKADNEAIEENVTNVSVGSRTVTVASQGTLKVELLTSDGTKTKDSVLLAGTANGSGKYLGELKFIAASEAIKVTELRLTNTGTADSSDIAEVQLVDSTGAVKAAKIPTDDGSVVFTGLSLPLATDTSTSYFIAVKAKGMNVAGDASSTAAQGTTIIYGITPVEGVVAQGVDGRDVALASDGTLAVVAVAQIDTLTPAIVEIGDIFSVTGIATGVASFTATAATVANVTAGLTAVINAAAGATVTAVSSTTAITLTAKVAGTAFTPVATATDGGVANTQTFTVAIVRANVAAAAATAATVGAGEYSNFVTKSKTSVISGAVLNSVVAATMSNTKLVGGEQVIGKYTLTFENGSNRTASNEELKAVLKAIVLTVTGSAGTDLTTAKVYIDGQASNLTANGTGTVDGGVDTLTFSDLSTLADGAKVDGPVTLVFTANAGLDGAVVGEYIQTSFANIDNDIDYEGDGLVSGLLLSNYLGGGSVTGATLSE